MAVATVFCTGCGTQLSPGAAFCSKCGHQQAAVAPAAAAPAAWPVATPAHVAEAHPAKTRRLLPWLLGGGGLVLLVAALAITGAVLTSAPQPGCEAPCSAPPPKSPPLAAPHLYRSTAFGFSVSYYDVPALLLQAGSRASQLVKVAQQDSSTIGWTLDLDGVAWPYKVTAEKAAGRSPDRVVQDLQARIAAPARFVYQIPQAGLGVDGGYGAVYDLPVRTSNGQTVHARLLLVVAVKGDTAVEMVAYGPYEHSEKGHPNPADTLMALVVPDIVSGTHLPGESTDG